MATSVSDPGAAGVRQEIAQQAKYGFLVFPCLLLAVAAFAPAVVLVSFFLVDSGLAVILLATVSTIVIVLLLPIQLLVCALAFAVYLGYEYGFGATLACLFGSWIVGNLFIAWSKYSRLPESRTRMGALVCNWVKQVHLCGWLLGYGAPCATVFIALYMGYRHFF